MFMMHLTKWLRLCSSAPRARRPRSVLLAIDTLEDRAVPSVSQTIFTEASTTNNNLNVWQVNGSSGADTLVVHHNGAGSFTVTDETGTTFNSPANIAIDKLIVRGQGGSDVVRYVLDSDVTRDVIVNVYLGTGNDRFTGTMRGDISDGQKMTMLVQGDGGADLMTMYATPTVPERANDHLTDGAAVNANGMHIGTGAKLDLKMLGNAGNDRIFFDYTGEQDGTLQFDLRGDDNKDVVSAVVNLQAGSTRGVGTSAPARVAGNRDNDNLTFKIFNNSGDNDIVQNAQIDGGLDVFWADNDVGRRTANVTPKYLETDTIV